MIASGMEVALGTTKRNLAMIAKVGESAGAIWNYLKDRSDSPVVELRKALEMNDATFWMAVGWLARENKLVFNGQGKEMSISLAEGER
jgi:hypothetical protein